MKIRPALALILCGAMAIGTSAMPIQYHQIGDAQVGGQVSRSVGSQTTTSRSGAITTSLTAESLDQPEFVRLSDGRLIPYGPGVICSDVCVESDVVQNPPGLSRKWLIAIPIAGAALIGLLLVSGDSSLPRPTAVSDNHQDPKTPTSDPTPVPSPTPGGEQPQPVPEPGTIALLGVGLALLSRKRVIEIFRRQ